MSAPDPVELIDVGRYPILDVGDCGDLIGKAQRGLAATGLAALEGFCTPAAIQTMCREAAALEPDGHHSTISGSPYLGLPDGSYDVGHPRRAEVDNSLTAIAYDRFPADSALRAIYEWEPLRCFLEAVLDRGPLHRYGDTLGALNVAAMRDGDELGWHFDMTDFVVSIALQSSVDGGEFECASRIRDADDERYDDVAEVLAGDRSAVTSVAMEPGTMLLFEGRDSLHRVTPIIGSTPRYVALLAYDTKPGTDSTELLKAVRYGRTMADRVEQPAGVTS